MMIMVIIMIVEDEWFDGGEDEPVINSPVVIDITFTLTVNDRSFTVRVKVPIDPY
jgi:hypothetical protein